jgi:hypothetical protein
VCADVEADAAGPGFEAGMGSLRECGDGCASAPSCGNRRTQRGVAVRLCVVCHLHKGWGLHAAEASTAGSLCASTPVKKQGTCLSLDSLHLLTNCLVCILSITDLLKSLDDAVLFHDGRNDSG